MQRRYFKDLEKWKNGNHKPLVLRGARQVGKTYLIREFGVKKFDTFIEFNFDENSKIKDYFKLENIDEIISMLEMESGKNIEDEKTLIFFDEIQSAPEVFHRLRYFYEKRPNLHIIAAGSLLDFVIKQHQFSMPVGRVEYMTLGPMTFSEFLLANEEQKLLRYLNEYTLKQDILLPIHEKLSKYFNLFLIIGGMPAVVLEFITSKKQLNNISKEQLSIIKSYSDDLNKYSDKIDSNILQNCFNKIPLLIGERVKFTNINSEIKSGIVKTSLDLLELAKVIKRVYHSASNGIPIGAERKEKDFKVLYLDVGLMSSILGLKLNEFYLSDDITLINKGDICEQFIGQHLLYMKESYIEPELYFWHRQEKNATAEVDFIYDLDSMVVPIEVKSGKSGSLKSLHMFLKIKQLKLGIRFNTECPNLFEDKKYDYKILSLPLYMIDEMKRLSKNIL